GHEDSLQNVRSGTLRGMTEQAPVARNNPMAITSLVLGGLAVVSAMLHLTQFSVLAGLVALVLGTTGFTRSKTLPLSRGRSMAVIGACFGVFGAISNFGNLWG